MSKKLYRFKPNYDNDPVVLKGVIKDLMESNGNLIADNDRLKAKSDEVFRCSMWVAMEFGKVLQERSDLQKKLKALAEKEQKL